MNKPFLFLISLFFLVPFCHIANAGDSPEAGVQISPIRFDWIIREGEEKTDKIYVHNFSDISHDVHVSVEDFLVSDDTMQAEFYVPQEEHPLKAFDVINWIDAPDDFTIAPGETKELEFHVKIPDGQPTNGYYGTIFFKTSASKADVDNAQGGSVQLGVNYRVGVLVTLAVQGDEPMRTDGYVEDFSPTQKVFWGDTMGLSARLRSDGNVHYKAGGYMTIKKNGKKFSVIEIDPEVLYPGKTRLFIKNTSFGPWDYGVYSADLNMKSEDGSVIFQGEIPRFFVVPLKTTITIVCGVIFGTMVLWWFKKKFAIVSRENLTNIKKDHKK
jgi:hypothetical protein